MDRHGPNGRLRGIPNPPSSRPLVLVADDSRIVTELLRRMLQQIGVEVITASDGISALNAGLERPIDLAILDQVMPGKVGAEVLQAWRAEGMTAPVIMISAIEDRRTRIEALRLGADQYLYKPLAGEVLLSEVQRLLEESKSEATR